MSVDSDCYLSVIAPLYNDADIIEPFIEELTGVLSASFANYEVVLVDDGSSDETLTRVSSLIELHERIRLIRLSRHFGQESAISAGLDSVIGDFVIVMLPDSDPPALVPELVEQARTGAEIVFGIRRERRDDPLFLRVGASAFYWYCNRVLRLDLPKNSTHFRVMSRRVVNALNQIRDRGRYLRTLSQHVGYGSRGFTYDLVERRAHPRKKSLLEAVDLAFSIIAANSVRPLRMVSWLGAGIAAANTLYVVYLTVSLLRGQVSREWAIGSIQTGIGFVFVFVILTVLCEYVGRIVDESKGRPLYHVIEERNSPVVSLDEWQRNVVTDSTSTET